MITVNIPRIAYESNGDDQIFFETLDERMDLAKEALEVKRDVIKKRMKDGALPFACMDVDGESYLKLDKQVLNIGFIGLNEALKAHTGEELHESQSAWKFGLKVIGHMGSRAEEYSKETGARFGILQTPAESTCHRLALIDRKKYGDKAVVQGDLGNGSLYYTNSSHVKPSADIPFAQRVKIEASFHPITRGGAITHVWLGEANPSPEAMFSLTKRLATRTLAAYFTYTKDLTICTKCSKMESGLLEKCPNCGAVDPDLEWWSRITGYYQQVKGWNAGKRAELKDRRRYSGGMLVPA
jgi:ribonucleoside-triphosphate reductase